MKTTRTFFTVLLLAAYSAVHATEYHVAKTGSDSNPGTKDSPLRTIQRAADLAHPGDTITVHAGTYRERVNPPRGGTSHDKRIVYRAALGEKVEIKGSEIVKGWSKVQADVWKVTLPNSFFGGFNPFNDLIHGDWFNPRGREHHTGAVYLNGEWLAEAAKLDEVMNPGGTNAFWFGKVEGGQTTIWAQFKGVDPNEQRVEINVRRTVFYPDKPGRNYITVRGFTLRHAATPWAPPTAEQIGLIGTHWSKGWIIERNTISHSTCSGIALGKHGDKFDNTSATAGGYVKTIERAHAHAIPWTKENIGHHIVRHNIITHCGQAGIVGSMGCAFSTVTDNVIHDIYVGRPFSGAEMAGIKFHGAIDVTISRNHIYRACRGLWLDWMAQGARVSRNLFHDNGVDDLYMEVDHGPYLIDNNLLLSRSALLDMSEGGAYVHNLFAGAILSAQEPGRETPYHPAHSTSVAGLAKITGGDNRFYNNLFIGRDQAVAKDRMSGGGRKGANGYGLWVYDEREFPLQTGGNVYLNGARPYAKELNPVVAAAFDPKISLVGKWLRLTLDQTVQKAQPKPVTTELLGKARIPQLPYENPDGTPLKVNTDYFGKPREESNPTPGPFEKPGLRQLELEVWKTTAP